MQVCCLNNVVYALNFWCLTALKQYVFVLRCPQHQRHLSSFKYFGESSCSCCGLLQPGLRFLQHPVRGEWQDNHA